MSRSKMMMMKKTIAKIKMMKEWKKISSPSDLKKIIVLIH
jgi:hypothetical protein